jgi:hypothetical protein
MRNLTITNQSWTVDDDDNVIAEDRMMAEEPVEAASLSYGYARL